MKQKRNSDKLLTKKYLDKTLDKRFLLNDAKFDLKLENLERRIDDKAQKYRDQILDSNDKLAKTLETMREEFSIGIFQTTEEIKNLKSRVKVLESP